MIYAHIFEHESKFYVWYRYPLKFNSESEEKLLENKIVTTLFEETEDLALLDKQVAEWKQIRGIEKIAGFENFSGMSFPDKDELISMLRQEAHRAAAYLERERKERAELQKKYDEILTLAKKRIFEYQTLAELQQNDISVLSAIVQTAEENGFDLSDAQENLANGGGKITYH